MPDTIETHLDDFQAATSDQIRVWSNGSVKRALRPFEHRDDWQQVIGTLWDQHIFGPVEDWRCACGRFNGASYSGAVCPVCNVKLGPRTARKFRTSHINLPVRFPHPFFPEAEPLDAIPIVPAAYWENRNGQPLVEAYEAMIHISLQEPSADEASAAFGRIIPLVETLYEHASSYDVEEAERLARGLALVPKPPEEEVYDDDDADDSGELRLMDE